MKREKVIELFVGHTWKLEILCHWWVIVIQLPRVKRFIATLTPNKVVESNLRKKEKNYIKAQGLTLVKNPSFHLLNLKFKP